MKEFIKKCGVWIFLTLSISFAVSYLWFVLATYIFPVSYAIDKKAWLSFWGNFLSFSGSFFLGAIAVYQTTKAYKQNEQTFKKDKEWERVKIYGENLSELIANMDFNEIRFVLLKRIKRQDDATEILINKINVLSAKIIIFAPEYTVKNKDINDFLTEINNNVNNILIPILNSGKLNGENNMLSYIDNLRNEQNITCVDYENYYINILSTSRTVMKKLYKYYDLQNDCET